MSLTVAVARKLRRSVKPPPMIGPTNSLIDSKKIDSHLSGSYCLFIMRGTALSLGLLYQSYTQKSVNIEKLGRPGDEAIG